jgi:GNAT superfamily N-acetyltransferase
VAAVKSVQVTTWFLEMTDPARLAPAPAPDPDLEFRQIELPSPELSRALYAGVGSDWYWTDRVSFGLLPAFIGRGIGTRLLDFVLRRAWAQAPARVWVHTCSLDGPAALRTYRGRGMEVYDERIAQVTLPERPPEPWPGAQRPAA